MKTRVWKILATTNLLALAMFGLTPSAGAQQVFYAISNNTAYVTGGYGNIVIASTYQGYPVTSIGDYAFWFGNVTNVTIPDSVTSIGIGAFEDCAGLTNVMIPNSVTNIEEDAFWECWSLPSVTIPDSVTSIGDHAFYFCEYLASVTIPDSITSISSNTFENCYGLTNVKIGNGVTSIGNSAFKDCDSLTSVTIPDNVTNIGDYAFYECYDVKSVSLGNSFARIGNYAFWSCNVTNVTGYNVTSVGDDAFEYCQDLTSVSLGYWGTSIGDSAFNYCNSLTNVTISDSVTNIGAGAFWECSSLTSVAIPDSVISLGTEAFGYCSGLTNVTIPTSITSIGQYEFSYCSALTHVTIPNSVSSIASYAFSGCTNLTGVYFLGDPPTPTNDLTVFSGDTLGIAYVLPNTTGWGAAFDGLPVMVMTNNIGTIVGSVSDIEGNVTVTHTNGTTSTLEPGDSIAMGDTIHTPAGGRILIQFKDTTSLTMTENSRLTIDKYIYDPSNPVNDWFLGHLEGIFVWTSGLIGKNNTNAEHIETSVGNIGIRGTEFISQQDPCSSTEMIYLIQGELAITPLNTPGVTNICDAPVTITVTPDSVTTNALDQATYDSVSNQLFQVTGVVTFPSWLEQYFGCTNNPDAAPTADPSGDGEDNYSKFLAGMNPTNPASYFHILSATPEGNNLLVSWMCGGGRTNVLQATTNLNGSWSNASPNIVLAGSGDSVTNYLDIGAVTNTPTRFYRVQLVQ